MKFCEDLEFPRDLMCSGCIHYLDAPSHSKSKGEREDTHTAKRFQCVKPWLWLDHLSTPGYFKGESQKYKWCQKIQQFLSSRGWSVSSRLKSTYCVSTSTIQSRPKETSISDITTVSSLTTETREEDNTITTTSKKRTFDEVETHTETILSYGHEFVFDGIPNTHALVTKSYLLRLRKSDEILKILQNGFDHERFTGGSLLMRSLIAVSIVSCPALPLSQAANMIPMFTAGALVDAGLSTKRRSLHSPNHFHRRHISEDLCLTLLQRSSSNLASE